MSDEAIGIAVLHDSPPRDESDYGYLYFIAKHSDGRTYVCDIPIVEQSRYETVKAIVKHPLWMYRIEGDTLHCAPSVNDQGHGWHNSYNWSVKFVRYTDEMGNAVHDAVRELNK